MSYFKKIFENLEMKKKGVLLNHLICNAMKTYNDEFEFQDAHTDYYYKAIHPKEVSGKWLAWSAIIPMTEQGSWICVYFDRHSPRSIHIKYGQLMLFRSDLVHCGGRP
jgi:hypothetical protein